MDHVVLVIVGLCMGLLGGMLGIGGSLVLIPALTFIQGENQHLYQAAAMICNFFVSAASLIAHRKAETFSFNILKWMAPLGVIGILGGVALSNCPVFEGGNSYILARVFGLFLIYVALYNGYWFIQNRRGKTINPDTTRDVSTQRRSVFSGICGMITGTAAGLLGIGAGTVSTPMQQFFLRLPLREAMSNSAAMIVCISWIGAIYKNCTLAQHGLHFSQSFEIAILVIPGAVIGGFIGGHLMHALPKNVVRIAFILVCAVAAYKLLTVMPG